MNLPRATGGGGSFLVNTFIEFEMYWDVVAVEPEEHLTLTVRFRDGTKGQVRFEPSYLTGVFAKLSDPSYFRQVRVEEGAVAWPGELDLAPDAMYRRLSRDGEWILK